LGYESEAVHHGEDYLPVDLAVDMILRAIPAIEAMKDIQRSRELLDDLILQQKIEIVLLNVNIRNIRVEVAGCVVTLRGNISSSVEASNYVSLVLGVEGVQKVNSYMAIYTPIGT
jgi:hypothetical protein